ncbi:hypothetical protein [Candidatus Albibeggiatoa sp. nov. BB20]|uniref:WD40 repeat domain-containing protein n=1 Tax=Candidatus Albibeggiatoa sp. nov. BB20 TaxID=3162723 RepID=UPI0033654E97
MLCLVIGVYVYSLLYPSALNISPDNEYTVPTISHATWDGHEIHMLSDIVTLAVSPDGKQLASGSSFNDYVQIRDIETGEIITEFEEDSDQVKVVKYHPTKPILAVGTIRNYIYLWNFETNEFQDLDHTHEKKIHVLLSSLLIGIYDIAFSPDGNLLASVNWDGSVAVWDIKLN